MLMFELLTISPYVKQILYHYKESVKKLNIIMTVQVHTLNFYYYNLL